MKTTGRFKLVLGLSLVAIVGLITLNSFSAIKHEQAIIKQMDSVNITIDSDTSDAELDDIKDMLNEHGITVKFSNIKRNEDGLLTGIKIELTDSNGNRAVSQTSSNQPIQTFSFGRKNGSLYITQGRNGLNNFAFFGDDMVFNFDHDSIMKLHFGKLDSLGFGNMFNFDNHSFSFNGKSLNIDELIEQMQNNIMIDEDDNGNKRIIIKKGAGNHFFFDNESNKPHQKFRFVDNPDTEKIIVIDGKESNFEKLDTLAKNDELETVDVLKPNTAMSIYGKKAKDGAIIATTKK
jgi:hypothetical protein